MPQGAAVSSSSLVVAVALAACSGDDDDETDSSTSTATSGVEATESTETTGSVATTPAVEPTYTFGLLGPGVGLLNELMIGQERGLTLAIEDINAAGGVLGGPVTVGARRRVDGPSDRGGRR